MTRKLAPCGTYNARRRHARNDETCQACDNAPAKALAPCGTRSARRRHAARGETCDTCTATKPKATPPHPCGTTPAYRRHHARNEPVDKACRDAYLNYCRNKRRSKGIAERIDIPLPHLVEDITFLLSCGEGEHAILKATGYMGRGETLRNRLNRYGHQHLNAQIFNQWELAA